MIEDYKSTLLPFTMCKRLSDVFELWCNGLVSHQQKIQALKLYCAGQEEVDSDDLKANSLINSIMIYSGLYNTNLL